MADYDVKAAFEAIEDELISSMIRNFRRHRDWEKKERFEWTQWQAMQLDGLKKFRKENKKVLGDYFLKINGKIEKMLKKAYDDGQSNQEAQILDAVKRGYIAPKTPFSGEASGSATFFMLNDRKLQALIDATQRDMEKAETATLRKIEDEYRKTIYNAQVYMNSGAGTLDKAIDMATKDFLAAGINSIQYKNGRQVGIDSYAEMALRTANRRAYLQGESAKRDEWDIHTVIVTRRGVACPRCLNYVGKIFIDDVWGSGKPNGKYPMLSAAISGGLYHPNCKDAHTTYFEGISTPPKPMTRAQKDEAERVYRLQQEQRYNERQVRKYKRLTKYSLDDENKAGYKSKLDYWQDRQERFISKNSDVLHRKPNRERIRLPGPPQLINQAESGIISPAARTALRNTGARLTYNPEADFSIKLPQYPDAVNNGLSKASAEVSKHSGSDGMEHLRLVDLDTGELVYQEAGADGYVGGKRFLDFIVDHKKGRYAFVHSHTTDGYFSETDMQTLLRDNAIKMFVATRIDGVKYIAEQVKTTNAFPLDSLYKEEMEQINILSRRGDITAGERTHMREETLVNNLLRDYTKGLIEIDGSKR